MSKFPCEILETKRDHTQGVLSRGTHIDIHIMYRIKRFLKSNSVCG